MATSGASKVSWAEIRLWRAGLLGAFLALWEVATRRGWVDPFFVSQPTVLAGQIAEWIRSGFIFRHLAATMEETLIGFLLGTVLGVAVGFLFARWDTLAHVFDPLMVALNAMPRVVLAPLFILWFGLGLLSKVVMVVSLVFFVVFFSTYTGIREVDRDLVTGQDAAEGAERRPEALCRVVRARPRGVPARLARQPGGGRPRHRDHARVRCRPGRHEDRVRERIRQPVRAEGAGALMATPASERGPDGAVESAEVVYSGWPRFNLGNVFDDRGDAGIVEDRREDRDESRLFNLEESELPSASVHFGREAPALARRGRS